MLYKQNRREAQVRRDDLTANREMMGDLREIQLEPEMNPKVEFLFDYGSPFQLSRQSPDRRVRQT